MAETIKIRNKETGEIITIRRKDRDVGQIRNKRITDLPFDVRGMALKGAEALPIAGQIGGAILTETAAPMVPGTGIIGSTMGAAIGESLRQGVRKAVLGEDFDPEKIAKDAAITATFEGLTRGIAAPLFKQFRAEAQKQALMPVINASKKRVNNFVQSNLKVVPKPNELYNKLVSMVDDAGGDMSEVPNMLKRTLFKDLGTKKRAAQYFDQLDFNALDRMKQKLFKVAKPDKERGLLSLSNQTRAALKNFGSYIQKTMEDIAEEAGEKQFSKTNKLFNKVAKEASPASKRGVSDFAIPSSIGAIVGFTTGSPVLGASAGLGTALLGREGVRRGIYRAIEPSSIGRLATVGASELGRRVTNQ